MVNAICAFVNLSYNFFFSFPYFEIQATELNGATASWMSIIFETIALHVSQIQTLNFKMPTQLMKRDS